VCCARPPPAGCPARLGSLRAAAQRGSPPLYVAAGNGKLEMVKALIAAKADVNHLTTVTGPVGVACSARARRGL
jgi:hypothetical protein